MALPAERPRPAAGGGWWAARSTAGRVGAGALLGLVTALLAVVIVTPIALSSQDLTSWAAAPSGLNLPTPWPLLVFLSLDAAAAACVLLTVYCAWRGEPAGVFGLLVWCFALGSAFANWRHSSNPDAAPDAAWFFPAMSLAGPALLEAVLGRFRRWAQRDHGRRAKPAPTYGWRRWAPGLGSPRDTYGAYRTAVLCGIDNVQESITAYHTLCPDGSLHVAAALRRRHNQTTPPPAPPQTPAPPPRPAQQDPSPQHATARAGPAPAVAPAALTRRIPARPEAYQRWITVWDELRRDGDTDLPALAQRHDISVRQVEFIRRAGRAHLLDSTVPPALRDTATTTASNGHQPPPAKPPPTRPTDHIGKPPGDGPRLPQPPTRASARSAPSSMNGPNGTGSARRTRPATSDTAT
jgi:Protein of unknown function (DUF2637)